jgi:hypothetical protein
MIVSPNISPMTRQTLLTLNDWLAVAHWRPQLIRIEPVGSRSTLLVCPGAHVARAAGDGARPPLPSAESAVHAAVETLRNSLRAAPRLTPRCEQSGEPSPLALRHDTRNCAAPTSAGRGDARGVGYRKTGLFPCEFRVFRDAWRPHSPSSPRPVRICSARLSDWEHGARGPARGVCFAGPNPSVSAHAPAGRGVTAAAGVRNGVRFDDRHVATWPISSAHPGGCTLPRARPHRAFHCAADTGAASITCSAFSRISSRPARTPRSVLWAGTVGLIPTR